MIMFPPRYDQQNKYSTFDTLSAQQVARLNFPPETLDINQHPQLHNCTITVYRSVRALSRTWGVCIVAHHEHHCSQVVAMGRTWTLPLTMDDDHYMTINNINNTVCISPGRSVSRVSDCNVRPANFLPAAAFPVLLLCVIASLKNVSTISTFST